MLEYISVREAAAKWGVSERSVRNYCAQGRVPGAFITGKTWNVPADAQKPGRKPTAKQKKRDLLQVLRDEKDARMPGGIYHRLQIDLTYNSNHIEGSRLTHDQTRLIFETRTIGAGEGAVNVDDVIEAVNHFHCIDYVIDTAGQRLTQAYIKRLHGMLKAGTQDASRDWFAVSDYKRLPNRSKAAWQSRSLGTRTWARRTPTRLAWTRSSNSTGGSSASTLSRTATAAWAGSSR